MGGKGGGSDSCVPITVYLPNSSSTPTSKDRRNQHSDQQRPKRPALRPAKTEETSTPTSKRPSSTALENNLINVQEAGQPVPSNLCTPQLAFTTSVRNKSHKDRVRKTSCWNLKQKTVQLSMGAQPPPPHSPPPLLPPSPQTVSRLLGSCSGEPKPRSIYGLRPMFRTHRFSVSFSCAYFYFFFSFF